MTPYKFYIQQCTYNGSSYTQGTVRESYADWGIVCSKCVFRHYGDPKDVSSRNWLDEHGEDVYIPANVKLKKFDAEYTFLCNGSELDVKTKVKEFHRYLMGMPWHDAQYNTVSSEGSRLIIYDTYNSVGWKDVRLKTFSADALVMDNGDDEVVLEFKVVFEVNDPYTTISRVVSHGSTSLVIEGDGEW